MATVTSNYDVAYSLNVLSRCVSKMSTNPSPTPRNLLTEFLSQLQHAAHPAESTGNPLKNASEETKNILLTLHVLYPNEFLPALDLLDRRLLTRFVARLVKSNEPETVTEQHQPNAERPAKTSLYFVHSAQQARTSTSGRSYDHLATHYEVRLAAWNCSCPAFAFAAFPSWVRNDDNDDQHNEDFHPFGGLSSGQAMPPICKHLLACALAEHCLMFSGFVEMKDVSAEELAGWCAGWGD